MTGLKDYLKLTEQMTKDMFMSANVIDQLVFLLKEDEYRRKLSDKERKDLFVRLDRHKWELKQTMFALHDLARFSSLGKLECKDKILINQLCCELAQEQDVDVQFTTDIPDYYKITTNEEVLTKVLDTLLNHATSRTIGTTTGTVLSVLDSSSTERTVPTVRFDLSERTEPGKLTFSITDTAGPTSREDDLALFTPPTEQTSDHNNDYTMVKVYNCRLMVQLLGGFIYVDPDYHEGRRIVFNIKI